MDTLEFIIDEMCRFRRERQRPARYVRVDPNTLVEMMQSRRALDFMTYNERDRFIMGVPIIVECDARPALYDDYLFRWTDI